MFAQARQHPLKAAVVGGSLGGLTAALLLRDLGCDVDVYERSSSELSGFGAGIVLHEATVRYFRERTRVPVEQVSVGSSFLRYLDEDGAVIHQEPCAYRYTSWSTLYRHLLAIFGEERYHRGHTLVGIEQDSESVQLAFATGETTRHDLVVCADGIMSTGRGLLLPEVELQYGGYVGWRGTVRESDLTRQSLEAVSEAITYGVVDHSHALAYPIPSLGGELDEGARLINFVWYRNVAAGDALANLMTARNGSPRAISLPPGTVRDEYVRDLRESALLLPPQLGEMVTRAEHPFVQVVVDVEVPRMAFGRVCLIGDAAFAARPHAAAGTAKAAEDAWKLAEAVGSSGDDVVGALRRWEPAQLRLGQQLVGRSRAMGERYQVDGSWDAADPQLRFGLYGPGR